MPNPPSGTVTFLFTDVEGSAKLWEQHPDAMKAALARHHAILHQAIESNNGYVFQIIGDAFCAAFHTAADAVTAALAAQRALQLEFGSWKLEDGNWKLEIGKDVQSNLRPPTSNFQLPTSNLQLRVRMGLHTGVAELRLEDTTSGQYASNPTLTRTQRIMSVGHGTQILLSNATSELLAGQLPNAVTLRSMGEHRLKGLLNPEHLWQVVAPDLPQDFPPLSSLNVFPNNLPVQLTSFVGREHELAEIKKLLSTTRLLTLTGVGGTGKTRLALQVAADLTGLGDPSGLFVNGVWFVELAPLSDPALVPQTVASVLNVREEAGRPLMATLTDFLHAKNLLLILDNCEHLLDACAQLATTLLRNCPDVTILATSREALGITGETIFHVPSLALPDVRQVGAGLSGSLDHVPAHIGRSQGSPLHDLTQYDSVRLFVDRAVAIKSDFQLTNANAPAVVQICQRVDGIPLALELAAARVKSLSVDDIAARLHNQFRLLTGGSRTALPRQQTLRALIDWSYNLLTEPERVLFRRLSVFAGGWTLEAAEQVCSGKGLALDEVVDVLDHLVSKSLVVADTQDGATRYRMLETIRPYAREKLLESGEGEQLRDRHLDFFLELAEDAEPKLRGAEQLAWFNRLETEHDNLRFALEWSLSEQRIEKGLRIGGALYPFWNVRGYWNEAYQRLSDLLKTQGADKRTLARGKALSAAGNIANRTGHLENSRPLFEESIAILREVGAEGKEFLEYALARYAYTFVWRDLAAARLNADEAARLSRASGNRVNLASALNVLGIISRQTGDFESARKYFEESAGIYREIGNSSTYSVIVTNLGTIYFDYGHVEKAKKCLEKAVEISRQVGNKQGFGWAIAYLGNIARVRGQRDEAESLLKQATFEWRELGDNMFVARELVSMGRLQLDKGNHLLAEQNLREALPLLKETNAHSFIPSSLESFAFLFSASNNPSRAAQLFGAAEALREKLGTPLFPIERKEYEAYLAAVRAQLDDSAFNAAWNEGRAMTMEQAIGLAMESSADADSLKEIYHDHLS